MVNIKFISFATRKLTDGNKKFVGLVKIYYRSKNERRRIFAFGSFFFFFLTNFSLWRKFLILVRPAVSSHHRRFRLWFCQLTVEQKSILRRGSIKIWNCSEITKIDETSIESECDMLHTVLQKLWNVRANNDDRKFSAPDIENEGRSRSSRVTQFLNIQPDANTNFHRTITRITSNDLFEFLTIREGKSGTYQRN